MTDPTQQIWWLAARASGVVALVLVTLSVLLGLAMAGRVMRKPSWRRAAVAFHEQAAIVSLLAVAVHGLTLLGDHWLHPGVKGILVPFAMGYRPLFSGLGILAGYLSALLGLSFYARKRIGTKRWRFAHRFTIVAYVMSVVHTAGAGTDAGAAWLQGFMVLTGIPIVALTVRRWLPRLRVAAPARARA